MEKDIDRIPKNSDTDIVIRVDDFGGKRGITIREFVKGERYTGFTKAGTRIPADKFKLFKAAINMIDEKDLEGTADEVVELSGKKFDKKPAYSEKKFESKPKKKAEVNIDDINYDEAAM
jgi:hypothetical protein